MQPSVTFCLHWNSCSFQWMLYTWSATPSNFSVTSKGTERQRQGDIFILSLCAARGTCRVQKTALPQLHLKLGAWCLPLANGVQCAAQHCRKSSGWFLRGTLLLPVKLLTWVSLQQPSNSWASAATSTPQTLGGSKGIWSHLGWSIPLPRGTRMGV